MVDPRLLRGREDPGRSPRTRGPGYNEDHEFCGYRDPI
jgi:hypothetical protein